MAVNGVGHDALIQLQPVDTLPFLHQFPEVLSGSGISVLARVHYSAISSTRKTFLYAVADQTGFLRVFTMLSGRTLQVTWRRNLTEPSLDVVWQFPLDMTLLRPDQYAVLSLRLDESMAVLTYHLDRCNPIPFFVLGTMNNSADIRLGTESWFYPEVSIWWMHCRTSQMWTLMGAAIFFPLGNWTSQR